MTFDRRARVTVLAPVLVITALSGAAVRVSLARCGAECAPTAATASISAPVAAPVPAAVSVAPGAGARDVDPLGAVSVTATAGTLRDVAMTNEQGTRIAGVMTPDNLVWKPGVPLGYSRDYALTITAAGSDGAPSTQTSTFSTLTPAIRRRSR